MDRHSYFSRIRLNIIPSKIQISFIPVLLWIAEISSFPRTCQPLGLWPCYGNLGVFIVCVFHHNHICRKRGFGAPPGCAWARARGRITVQGKCGRCVCQYIQVISKADMSGGEERKTKCLPQQELGLAQNMHGYPSARTHMCFNLFCALLFCF